MIPLNRKFLITNGCNQTFFFIFLLTESPYNIVLLVQPNSLQAGTSALSAFLFQYILKYPTCKQHKVNLSI